MSVAGHAVVMPKGHIPGTRAVLVSLREITSETVRQITRLSVSLEQQRLVASNAISLAEALFSPNAWYRAIELAHNYGLKERQLRSVKALIEAHADDIRSSWERHFGS